MEPERRRPWALIVVTVCVLGAAAAVMYALTPVPVQRGERISCIDPNHHGSRLVSEQIERLSVPRYQVGRYAIQERSAVCKACEAVREAQRQAANNRRARLVSRVAAASRPTNAPPEVQPDRGSGLQAAFSFTNGALYEQSLYPGQPVAIGLTVRNWGARPVRGLRVLVRPSGVLAVKPVRQASGAFDSTLNTRRAACFRDLLAGGRPVVGRNSGKMVIPPYGSPYYPREDGCWSSRADFDGALCLSPTIKPGQDVRLTGYLVTGSRRQEVATLLIHVMYPEQ